MLSPELQRLIEAVGEVSEHWVKNIKGSLVGMMLRRYMVFFDNPQHYGHVGETFFATNFSQLIAYLRRIVKAVQIGYGYDFGYMSFKLDKQVLLELSRLWFVEMQELVYGLLSKYRSLENP